MADEKKSSSQSLRNKLAQSLKDRLGHKEGSSAPAPVHSSKPSAPRPDEQASVADRFDAEASKPSKKTSPDEGAKTPAKHSASAVSPAPSSPAPKSLSSAWSSAEEDDARPGFIESYTQVASGSWSAPSGNGISFSDPLPIKDPKSENTSNVPFFVLSAAHEDQIFDAIHRGDTEWLLERADPRMLTEIQQEVLCAFGLFSFEALEALYVRGLRCSRSGPTIQQATAMDNFQALDLLERHGAELDAKTIQKLTAWRRAESLRLDEERQAERERVKSSPSPAEEPDRFAQDDLQDDLAAESLSGPQGSAEPSEMIFNEDDIEDLLPDSGENFDSVEADGDKLHSEHEAFASDPSENLVAAEFEALLADELEALVHDEPEALAHDEPEALAHDEPEALVHDEPEALVHDEPEALVHDEPEALVHDEPEAPLVAPKSKTLAISKPKASDATASAATPEAAEPAVHPAQSYRERLAAMSPANRLAGRTSEAADMSKQRRIDQLLSEKQALEHRVIQLESFEAECQALDTERQSLMEILSAMEKDLDQGVKKISLLEARCRELDAKNKSLLQEISQSKHSPDDGNPAVALAGPAQLEQARANLAKLLSKTEDALREEQERADALQRLIDQGAGAGGTHHDWLAGTDEEAELRLESFGIYCASGDRDGLEKILRTEEIPHRTAGIGLVLAAGEAGPRTGMWLVRKLGVSVHFGGGLPLLRAFNSDNMEFFFWLVEQGANIHVGDEHYLRAAAVSNDAFLCERLLYFGANPSAAESRPLREAAVAESWDAVEALLAHGANPFNDDGDLWPELDTSDFSEALARVRPSED